MSNHEKQGRKRCRQSQSGFGKGGGLHSKKRKLQRTGRPIESEPHYKILKTATTDLKCTFVKTGTIDNNDVDSNCIINLENLSGHISSISLHACTCPQAIEVAMNGGSPIQLVGAKVKSGLASVIQVICKGCKCNFDFDTSKTVVKDDKLYNDVNIRAVWGAMSTGSGHSALNELFGTMNIHGPSQKVFSDLEHDINKWWEKELLKEMKRAGEEEKVHAEETGSFFQGLPAVRVICDGGWSKRSHKHTYNANGGVGVIIGAHTKKLLFVGVRNKLCSICKDEPKENVKPHECFKNWTASSQAMESDIIVEGFMRSEEMHGIRYMELVGDGDSSVYAKIQECVDYGQFVRKIECANHVCKCLRTKLEKLVEEKPKFKGQGKLTQSNRIKIVSAARCCIKLASQNKNMNRISQLKKDLINIPYHIFGDHSNCGEFCKGIKSNVEPLNEKNNTIYEDPVTDLINEQIRYWTEGASDECLEKSRYSSMNINTCIENKEMLYDVVKIMNTVASKADRLIDSATSNLAESWMSVRAKFDGGKMINRCGRGSWHARCNGASLRWNLGPDWSPGVYSEVFQTKAGYNFRKTFNSRKHRYDSARKYKLTSKAKTNRFKRKMKRNIKCNTRSAKMAYGAKSIDVSADVPLSELKQKMKEYYDKNYNKPEEQLKTLTTATIDQSKCDNWISERKKRLTSSNFGLIIKRKEKTPVKNCVKQLLYSTFKGNSATKYGLIEEDNTILEYKVEQLKKGCNVEVKKTGLCVDFHNQFLAASPDGIINNEGLIEIKQVLTTKNISLIDAAKRKVSNFCLTLDDNENLKLKKNHDYYYQCQGQLNITGYQWCDIVVRNQNPHEIYIERIEKDTSFWTFEMLPKLKKFFDEAVLPELSCPRFKTTGQIREPSVLRSSVLIPQPCGSQCRE